jgi:hypothetical protein
LPDALKPEKNFFKILNFTVLDLDPFRLEHIDFSLDRSPRRMPFKSPNPTGCGNNPMSGDLRRIGVSFHGLANPPVGFGSQGMGDFAVGCDPACRYFPQQVVGFVGKFFHFYASHWHLGNGPIIAGQRDTLTNPR